MLARVKAEFPRSLAFLAQPARYKVAYGGRGGAKSWAFARQLLIDGAQKPLRILCGREFQSSISDSVHKLLSDQIYALGLDGFYTIEKARIYGRNGTEFGFEGLRHNVSRIKSYEGADRCWVEEAKDVSKSSWETLIPTIRKAGSEIWVSFNPELDTDETYKRFVLNPPPEAIVRKVNWSDNPWFPEVLFKEKELLRVRDEDAYLNIWEGHCRQTLEGAVYAKELRLAQSEGRLCKIPYDESCPVHTFWDLGWADCTSILFAQKVGFEYRVIDAYQSRLEKLPHYLKVLQERGYVYGTHYLPHDADHETIGAKSIKKQMEAVGHKAEVMGRVEKKKLGINAVRTIFNRLYIDEAKCSEFLQCIRHYAYKVDEHGQWSDEPKHDENSHYADALQCLGQSINTPPKLKEQPIEIEYYSPDEAQQGWMAA